MRENKTKIASVILILQYRDKGFEILKTPYMGRRIKGDLRK
jgi:hypothetical protein